MSGRAKHHLQHLAPSEYVTNLVETNSRVALSIWEGSAAGSSPSLSDQIYSEGHDSSRDYRPRIHAPAW